MVDVKIYTTPTCHFCKMTKEFFKENSVKYEEINVAGNPDKAKEMIEKSGQMGVPVIIIDDEVIVGFDEPRIASTLVI